MMKRSKMRSFFLALVVTTGGTILSIHAQEEKPTEKEITNLFGRTDAQAGFPEFSWDKVPLAFHLGLTDRLLNDQELTRLAKYASIVTFEKSHGLKALGATDKGFAHDVKRLKALNPKVKVLFYWNLFVIYESFYSYMKEIQPEWVLQTRSGKALTKFTKRKAKLYDLLNPELQQWWSDVAAKTVESTQCDGIFVDAVAQPWHWYKRSKYAHPTDNTALMSQIKQEIKTLFLTTKSKMGEQASLIYNGIYYSKTRPVVGREYLSHSDGAMIERFTGFAECEPEVVAANIAHIQEMGKLGKMVIVKAWPSNGLYWRDKKAMKRPFSELVKEAKQYIEFPLACYLVAAEKYAYFCYSWGFSGFRDTKDVGWFLDYPEYDKKLGKPQGQAIQEGFVYTRTFEHASVWVNVETREAKITWESPSQKP